jgi:hypothetical protein
MGACYRAAIFGSLLWPSEGYQGQKLTNVNFEIRAILIHHDSRWLCWPVSGKINTNNADGVSSIGFDLQHCSRLYRLSTSIDFNARKIYPVLELSISVTVSPVAIHHAVSGRYNCLDHLLDLVLLPHPETKAHQPPD